MQKSGKASKQMSQKEIAQTRFELENQIDEEVVYRFDEDELQNLLNNQKPWKKDPHHFKKVKISAVALIKMVMHAKSGGDIEVMGVMQGYPVGDTMYVMDAFGLPVEGTETRVNAGKDADEYLFDHQDKSTQVSRPEYICGWYHSHPGYGCWLSGIDVMTQQTQQMVQDPSIAIVIDPWRTMAAGKVDIGCFRAYQNSYAEKLQKSVTEGGEIIPGSKYDDYGMHAHKYYQLEHTFFKSQYDLEVLNRLWNEYWINTLSSSPLLNNQDFICQSVINIVEKMKTIKSTHMSSTSQGRQERKKRQPALLSQMMGDHSASSESHINIKPLEPIQKESSKLAVDVSHGIMVEALKNFMFAK